MAARPAGTAAAAADNRYLQEEQQQAPQPQPSSTSSSGSSSASGAPRRFEELMLRARQTHIAQELWGQVIRPGDTVVDATCGNGHDTAYLAQAVGRGGTVHAYDVQAAAIEATQQLVASRLAADEAPEVHYHQASHADMLQHVAASSARVVVFNLGYLPGSDKATTTQQSSTVAAVQAACEVLQPGGLCSILCYTGHPGGTEEYEAVRALVGDLPPSGWVSSEVQLLNRPSAPVLLLVWKRA